MVRGRRIVLCLAAVSLAVVAPPIDAAVRQGPAPPASPAVQIRVLSNRADLVSGGDALVDLVLPPNGSGVTVALNGVRLAAVAPQLNTTVGERKLSPKMVTWPPAGTSSDCGVMPRRHNTAGPGADINESVKTVVDRDIGINEAF